MDGARISPLPHYSWFGWTVEMQPATRAELQCRGTTHAVALGLGWSVSVRWIHRGLERLYHHDTHQVAFFPADDEHHVRILRSADVPSSGFLLKLPRSHLGDLVESDEGRWSSDCRSILPRDDSVLRECTLRLAATTGHGVANDIGAEVAARRLVMRLAEVQGGQSPTWLQDESLFRATVVKQIVDYIDARPHARFHLEELSSLVGYSPSHFAKKFRATVGISVGRLINRRRLAAAMIMLTDDSRPLSQVALDLGFSSQSHFTRLFSALIGVTPARYRKQFRRKAAR
jgi:AraC-like DNA-binding protein